MYCPTLKDLPSPPKGKNGWPWTEENPRLPDKMPGGRLWPKISIVTPNYNYGEFIEETIRSVLLQGYPNLEYIIIDDGSTDNSVATIQKYNKWLAYWTTGPNQGQSRAINKGFSKATGEIFAWVNSDDIFSLDSLGKVGMYWFKHPQCHFLTGDGEYVNLTLKRREYYIKANSYLFKDLFHYYRGKYLPQPSVFFSKEAFHRVNGLDNRLFYAMDLDLWFRLTDKYPLHYLPACLSKLRHHEQAKTWKVDETAMKEVNDIITKYAGRISLLNRFFLKVEVSFFYTSALCQHGLGEYFNKNRASATKALIKALYINPAVLFSPQGIKLYLRLILPDSIKKFIFKQP